MDQAKVRVNGARLRASLEEMAKIGATPAGGVQRLALSDEDDDTDGDSVPDATFAATHTVDKANAIESVNSVIRKFTRNRKIYPNEDSALKLVYMAIREASGRWTMPIRHWKEALNHFAILFEDRIPQPINN